MSLKITIVGLGSGEYSHLTLGVYNKLKNSSACFVRTKHHPLIHQLESEGISFFSFDYLYEESSSFEDVYVRIVEHILLQQGEIVYAVPGHPMVAEKTVQLLRSQNINVEIIGGESFLDQLFTSLNIDPINGFQLLDAPTFEHTQLNPSLHTVLGQVYDSFTASEAKLTLMEVFPDEYEVCVAHCLGVTGQEVIQYMPLYEIDRVEGYGNLSLIYVPPTESEEVLNRRFSTLEKIIEILRGPNGCPWDQIQTHESLQPYLIEEAYEVLEAISKQDYENLEEELGDILLQVFLHAQIRKESGDFTVYDIVQKLNEKIKFRHPHVFEDPRAENDWEKRKQLEGKKSNHSFLPALMQAEKNLKYTVTKEEVLEMLLESLQTKELTEERLAKILTLIVQYARAFQLHPEIVLGKWMRQIKG